MRGLGSVHSRKRRVASLVAAHLAVAATRSATAAAVKLIREERAIAATARNLAGGELISDRGQLEAVHSFVAAGVADDPRFRFLPRPLLRQTAIETLRRRRGFCGESARVTVLLLRALGIRANRVYLVGERWNHVIVEHEWLDGGWYMFDAFPDPATQMTTEQLCTYESADPTTFPNVHDGNPWVDYYRWRPLVLRGTSRSRPPESYVRATERPDAIRAGLGALAAGGTLTAGLVTARSADG